MDCFEGSSVQVGDGISDNRPGIYIPWTPCIKLLVALAEAYAGGGVAKWAMSPPMIKKSIEKENFNVYRHFLKVGEGQNLLLTSDSLILIFGSCNCGRKEQSLSIFELFKAFD